ncbi:toxin-antitoxin system YwqK family antitoxin [Fluviicola taffensis]|uniref:MORN variant repeat-containing protein n=1 Tax=Fluviicola taffensis (strain DSM 16823 / NCIMB 13979 / RW262) TaxID=755732 RepID=F2IHP3_FLUTR|nr:toxin-antitoxin system YwqK family antitoxin [Fluviicola taffensis]AEA44821.1 MORN variant repeat-containing protein [Fluviicola taffensis DSM 16823]
MKFLVAIFCLFSLAASAQPNFGIARKDSLPCYQKSIDRSKARYTEWECGKIAGVVDCNQKLEMGSDGKRVVTSSQKMPYSGMCETCHMNGILERRVTFVDGFANGVDTTYYKSGCIMVIRSHVQGVEDGKWTYYNDSTQIPAWQKTYVLGQFEGPQLTYNSKGDTAKLENFSAGVLNGLKVTYDSKGGKVSQMTYVKGVLNGPFLLYNRKGEIIEELTYKEGKKHGVFHYYYDDGKLLRTENWDMDSRNGEFKTLYHDGKVQTVENYKKVTPKSTQYMTADLYSCPSKEVATALGQMFYDKKTKAQVMDSLNKTSTIIATAVRGESVDDNPILKGKKFGKGVNQPFKYEKSYYIVIVSELNILAKKELREGMFEEYFPDGKVKSRAIYKKDVLVEEHVFDEQGREIRTFGGNSTPGKEDDAMPTTKKKKEKKKKEPKPEETKPKEGE